MKRRRINRVCFFRKKRRIGRRVELMRLRRGKEADKELCKEEVELIQST